MSEVQITTDENGNFVYDEAVLAAAQKEDDQPLETSEPKRTSDHVIITDSPEPALSEEGLTKEQEIAIAAIDKIEADYRNALRESYNTLKKEIGASDFMSLIKQEKMIENLQITIERLQTNPRTAAQLVRAKNVKFQLESLTSFDLLKRALTQNIVSDMVQAAIFADRRGQLKQHYKDLLAMALRRLAKTRKYTYADPAPLCQHLKAALPEGTKHYAVPFMVVLLSVAAYQNLETCSTFLTQTFNNIRNMRYPEKHPEILTGLMKFCEDSLNCSRTIIPVIHGAND